MPRALISVSDKSGLAQLAKRLVEYGWEIVASGGTAAALRADGVAVTDVEHVTGQAELLGGRVKTLHPAIHAGILARDTPEDLAELQRSGIPPIALVVCNLYPFTETIKGGAVAESDAIEAIDIGGVALLRAAAKNFDRVAAVCDPDDYAAVVDALAARGRIDSALRRRLAAKAFAHTREYDAAIHNWLTGSAFPDSAETIPAKFALNMSRSQALRYGENPHQAGAWFSADGESLPLGSDQLGGKGLSYNNILDVDAAWRAASSFTAPSVVIVKHLNPIGIASDSDMTRAFRGALASDPLSAFGGVIAANRAIDVDFVRALGALFVECLVAPDFTQEALESLRSRRKNCRLLRAPKAYPASGIELRSAFGGMLLQERDAGDPANVLLKTVTRRVPTEAEMESLKFAWSAVQHVKSNAILLAQGSRSVGMGGGLPSRVDAVQLAIAKAGDEAAGAALASDAFFPFADGIEAAARAGVTCVIQPGGSIRDAEVIAAADDSDIAMVFTGSRHFRH